MFLYAFSMYCSMYSITSLHKQLQCFYTCYVHCYTYPILKGNILSWGDSELAKNWNLVPVSFKKVLNGDSFR